MPMLSPDESVDCDCDFGMNSGASMRSFRQSTPVSFAFDDDCDDCDDDSMDVTICKAPIVDALLLLLDVVRFSMARLGFGDSAGVWFDDNDDCRVFFGGLGVNSKTIGLTVVGSGVVVVTESSRDSFECSGGNNCDVSVAVDVVLADNCTAFGGAATAGIAPAG